MNNEYLNSMRSDLIWAAVKYGAFQRGNIYKKVLTNANHLQSDLRKTIKEYLHNEIFCVYFGQEISEIQLYILIGNLQVLVTKKHGIILQNEGFRFGNAQKFVNLYLKAMWIAGWLKAPPHFPVDRIIQRQLPIIYPWTNMNIETYKNVITSAQIHIKNLKYNSIAEWELIIYAEIQNDIN